MKILRIDHIAIATAETDPALSLFCEVLGLQLGPRELVPTQGVEATFLLTPAQGEACIELIAPVPRGQNVALETFVGARGGLHHVAFAVDDLAAALRELHERGVPLIDRVPRPGARGHQVGFLHPKALGGVLVELVEAAHNPHPTA